MSIVPLMVEDLLGEEYRGQRRGLGQIFDQHFGTHILEEMVRLPQRHSLLSVPLTSGYLRPWRLTPPAQTGSSNVQHDKDGFKVTLDVDQFKPEEVKVKVVDRFLVVEAKHEERSDRHGLVSRQFTRRYRLPHNIDDQAVESSLSSDGVLTIHAPTKNMLPAIFYQEIPIILTDEALPVNGPKEKKRKEEKSLLPYYRNIPIIQMDEPKEGAK